MNQKSQSEISEATNGINQIWSKPHASNKRDDTPTDEDEEGLDMQEHIQLFCDKETMPFLEEAYRTQPFAEWKCANGLIATMPEFTKGHRPIDIFLKKAGKCVNMHFSHTNLQWLDETLWQGLHRKRKCNRAVQV